MRVSHVGLGHMEHDVNIGAGDGHTDVGVDIHVLVDSGDSLDTVGVQVSVVQKQVGSRNKRNNSPPKMSS